MASTSESLIKLDSVTKVFLTDEVETHALSGVHLEIRNGWDLPLERSPRPGLEPA
jgi:putative ABC transport system ATP-binding protein